MKKTNLITRYRKLVIHSVFDAVGITAALYLSFFLRVGQDVHTLYWPIFLKFLALYIPIRITVFYFMGVYKIFWRYVTAYDAVKIAKSVLLSSAILIGITFLIDIKQLPRSVFIMEMIISALTVMGIRLIRRQQFERSINKEVKQQGQRTLIYGAGFNGHTLAKRFKQDSNMRTHVVGFIDDDPEKSGKTLDGVKVLGDLSDLASLIETLKIEQVIVSITDPPGETIRKVLGSTKKYNIKPQIISSREDKSANILRPLELHDLLNRPQRNIDFSGIKKLIQNNTVLVTGAGGSIGGEIARQIWSFQPKQLLLLDHNEYALYEIDNELRLDPQSSERIVPLLIDLKDRQLLHRMFAEYKPTVVFHAAAYKHVHLVQANPYSAILNNVNGTLNLFELCEANNVSTAVLISTDKAVNPVGIMGATKRVCEMLVTAIGLTSNKNYCAVRFGNVLGSSGSLIPLVQKQIQSGGPITVTHKDMTRYFMLIPEAVSLVLNAAILAKPGDLQVLKMGEPIRILDVVKSVLAYSGHSEEDMPIEFIGLRPGEKMFEELYISGKELNTENPDILTVPNGDDLDFIDAPQELRESIENIVGQICLHAQKSEKEAITKLNRLIREGLSSFSSTSKTEKFDQSLSTNKRMH